MSKNFLISRPVNKSFFKEGFTIPSAVMENFSLHLSGGRLGLGGGYYDRFLPRAVNAVKVALAYDFQLVDALPTEAHDAKINAILTTERSYCHEVH